MAPPFPPQSASIAQAFVTYVLSPPGEQVLKAAGFEQPA